MSEYSDVIDDGPPIKKRKVRKGTQSCWECKRRKVRCLFAVPINTICDNCVRRKTTCISQEYDDHEDAESSPKRNEMGIDNRLRRVEDTLQQLLHGAKRTPLGHQHDLSYSRQQSSDIQQPGNTTDTDPIHNADPSSLKSYSGVAQDLLKAWPSEADMVEIYALPITYSTHSHMNFCTSSSRTSNHEPLSAEDLLRLPPPGCHPVLIARKLLFLGSLLQGAVSTPSTSSLMRERFCRIMTNAIETATRFTSTDDTLMTFVEGLECIMLEAMIHNYTGNMHRAWMAVRRATAIAQTIGLHRGNKLPTRYILDPDTQTYFDPDAFRFRIVEMDCYLSVMLGLPRSSLESPRPTSEVLAGYGSIHRMARLQCEIAGYIIVSNDRANAERSTQDLIEVEMLLQQAASEMPPRWWLIPEMAPGGHDNASDPFRDIARINYQFAHYHLVMRLHLPYMVCSAHHEHSKLAAAGAGRETLARYLSFRRWNPGHFYCRGVDYIAFIAITVLCLAHIDSSITAGSRPRPSLDTSALLAQNHLADRGLMECTVEILQSMRNDATASRLGEIMQHLLDVEANSAKGVVYDAVAEEDPGEPTDCGGKLENSNGKLKLRIPYFGTVVLQRELGSRHAGAISQPQSDGPSLSAGVHDLLDQQPSVQWNYQYSGTPGPSDNRFAVDGNNLTGEQAFDDLLDFAMPNDSTLKTVNESLFSSLFGNLGNGNVPYDFGTDPLMNFDL
jgi:hypothetical protein